MSTSVESEVLVKYRDTLHGVISGSIIKLSVRATTANLLTTEEQEKCTHQGLTLSEQANQFMHFITHKVNNDPATLSVFINKVLGPEPAFSKTAHEMLAALNNAKETVVAAVQETGGGQATATAAGGVSGFSESLTMRDLSDWLKSEGLSTKDRSILKDQNISGSCFLDLDEEVMKEMNVSFGGRKSILKLQSKIKGGGVAPSPPTNTKTLEITDLRFLVNETWDARNKWQHIGRDLGIDKATLESTASAKREKADECYPEMLSVWLRRDGAKWETLLEVLASPLIGFDQLASKIRSYPADKKRKIGYF